MVKKILTHPTECVSLLTVKKEKVSDQREYCRKVLSRESSLVEDDKKVLQEWVCETRSE